MAKRSRPARPQGGTGPRKGGFLRGLVLGLAVAAGVQLHHAGLPDWFEGAEDDGPEGASRIEPSKTNFDFYRLLPKTEVRIDEPDESAERTAARPSPDPGREPVPEPRVPPSATREYRVQVGSFRARKEADRLRASLALGGFETSIQTRETSNGTWHRVTLGPFRSRDAAEAAKARVVTARGIDARIVPGKS